MRFRPIVLVCGSGRIATAVAHRLFRSRFKVIMTASEGSLPLLRRNTFHQAIVTGSFEVEGVSARKGVVTEALSLVDRNVIPLLSAGARGVIDVLNPDIVVDARVEHPRGDLSVGDASLVIGINGDFNAGVNCDLVINASPGHDLGRIFYRGPVIPAPADPPMEKDLALLHSPAEGLFSACLRPGQTVMPGGEVGRIGSHSIISDQQGFLSGILPDQVEVPQGAVVAEMDTSGNEVNCYTISALGRNVSGSVLESLVAWIADVGGQ